MPQDRKTLAAIFVRHGATDANKGEGDEELVRGQKEYPLNASGRSQADAAGSAIAKNTDISQVFSSPLSRGKDTAKSIAKATGAQSQVTKGLLPWDKGDAEGKPAKTEDPKLRRFAQDRPDTPVPGGESYNAFAARNEAAAKSIVNAGKQSVAQGKGPVAAVSHSVDLRLLPSTFEGKARPDPLAGGPEPGDIVGVTRDSRVVKLKPGLWGSR